MPCHRVPSCPPFHGSSYQSDCSPPFPFGSPRRLMRLLTDVRSYVASMGSANRHPRSLRTAPPMESQTLTRLHSEGADVYLGRPPVEGEVALGL